MTSGCSDSLLASQGTTGPGGGTGGSTRPSGTGTSDGQAPRIAFRWQMRHLFVSLSLGLS